MAVNEGALVKIEKGKTSQSEKKKEQLIEDEVDRLIPRRMGDRD